MNRPIEVPQWMLWCTISHGPKFGHALTIETVSKAQERHQVSRCSWTGIGIPPSLLLDSQNLLCSVLGEHVVTRYGVAQELF